MKKFLEKPYIRSWLALVGAITIVLGTVYATAQQTARYAADDKSKELMSIVASRLMNGADPTEAIPEYNSDVTKDDLTFAVITSKDRQVLASSFNLDGNPTALPPVGVFDNARDKINSITWKPNDYTRLAISVSLTRIDNSEYYIMTGHSLKETEKKITLLGTLSLIGWLSAVSWVTLIYFFAGHLHENTKRT